MLLMGAHVSGKRQRGRPPRKERPRFLLLRELLKQSNDLLSLHLVRSFPEHLFRIGLPPVNPERGQLRRERHARLPEGERVDDPPGGEVDQGKPGTAGLAHAPAVAAEDPERAGHLPVYLNLPGDCGPDRRIRDAHREPIPEPRQGSRTAGPHQLPQVGVRPLGQPRFHRQRRRPGRSFPALRLLPQGRDGVGLGFGLARGTGPAHDGFPSHESSSTSRRPASSPTASATALPTSARRISYSPDAVKAGPHQLAMAPWRCRMSATAARSSAGKMPSGWSGHPPHVSMTISKSRRANPRISPLALRSGKKTMKVSRNTIKSSNCSGSMTGGETARSGGDDGGGFGGLDLDS